ncbi:unnamed protein product, partial [Tetraodon nigroviridis]
ELAGRVGGQRLQQQHGLRRGLLRSLCAEGLCLATGGRCDRSAAKLSAMKVRVGGDRR